MNLPQNTWEFEQHFAGGADHINGRIMQYIYDSILPTYIFCNDREKRHVAYCSHCQKYVDLRALPQWKSYKHNAAIRCPKCGYLGELKHAWRGIKSLRNEAFFYYYEKSEADSDAIVCRGIEVYRDYGWQGFHRDPADVKPEILAESAYVFMYGQGGAMEFKKYQYGSGCSWVFSQRRPVSHYGKYYCKGKCLLEISYDSIERAVEDTPFKWSCWREFTEENTADGMVVVFSMFAKYKAWEWLTKMGLKRLLAMYASGRDRGELFNWRGKTIEKVLKVPYISKEDKKYMLEHGEDISRPKLNIWQSANKFQGISLKTIVTKTPGWQIVNKRLDTVLAVVPLAKLIEYMDKQMKKEMSIYDYADYIEECKQLNFDLSDKYILLPKDLRKAHINTSRQVGYKKNELLEQAYHKRLPKLKRKYEFTADGLTVVVPPIASDLIAEGKMQNNCVGGYIKRVAEGETDVVYIRKNSDTQSSYCTVEIEPKTGKILQARMKRNSNASKDVNAFLEKFEAFMAENMKTKKINKVRKGA